MTQSGHNYSYVTSPLFKGLPYLDSDCAWILNLKIEDCAKAKLLLVHRKLYRLTFKQLKSKANFVVRLLGDWNVKNEEICRGSFLSGINWLYPSLFKARIPKKGNIAQNKKYFSRFLYLKRLQSDRLTK